MVAGAALLFQGLMRYLLDIFIVCAYILIFEESFIVSLMHLLTHLAAHLLTLVTGKDDLLVVVYLAVALLLIDVLCHSMTAATVTT